MTVPNRLQRNRSFLYFHTVRRCIEHDFLFRSKGYAAFIMITFYPHFSLNESHLFSMVFPVIRVEIKYRSKHFCSKMSAFHNKRADSIFSNYKITFPFQDHFPLIITKYLGVSQSRVFIQPHFTSIWKNNLFHLFRNRSHLYLPNSRAREINSCHRKEYQQGSSCIIKKTLLTEERTLSLLMNSAKDIHFHLLLHLLSGKA